MKKILVLGSMNMDLVTKIKRTPKVGETVLGTGLTTTPGGKGGNQAVAIGRLGGDVTMIGKLGDDVYGELLFNSLSTGLVKCEYVGRTKKYVTGTAFILVNEDGNNSIVVIPGANSDILPKDISSDYFVGKDYFLAQLEVPIPTVEKAFELAKHQSIFTVLNPAPAKKLPSSLMKNIDLLVPNENEFETLTGYYPDTNENRWLGANQLFQEGIKAVLITLGEKGACYMDASKKEFMVEGYKVKAIDTTAAGDSFIGGLMTKLSEGYSIEVAIEFAMKVGALTVSQSGAQSSLPWRDEVEKFQGKK